MLEASDNVDTAEESRSSLVRGTVDDLLNRRGQGFDFLPGSLAEVQAIEKSHQQQSGRLPCLRILKRQKPV